MIENRIGLRDTRSLKMSHKHFPSLAAASQTQKQQKIFPANLL
jgi:hypothetical protein